jgi:hypothetical protein
LRVARFGGAQEFFLCLVEFAEAIQRSAAIEVHAGLRGHRPGRFVVLVQRLVELALLEQLVAGIDVAVGRRE